MKTHVEFQTPSRLEVVQPTRRVFEVSGIPSRAAGGSDAVAAGEGLLRQ